MGQCIDLDAHRRSRRPGNSKDGVTPTVCASTANALGVEDGRAYLVIQVGDEVMRVPLLPADAASLARGLAVAGRVADRRSRGLVELLAMSRDGSPAEGAPPVLASLVERRGDFVLLKPEGGEEPVWYSAKSGEPVRRDRRKPYARISKRDALFLRTMEDRPR